MSCPGATYIYTFSLREGCMVSECLTDSSLKTFYLVAMEFRSPSKGVCMCVGGGEGGGRIRPYLSLLLLISWRAMEGS